MQEYKFKGLLNIINTVVIDDISISIQIVTPLRKINTEIPISSLRYLYLDVTKDSSTLYFTYEPEYGKIKKTAVSSIPDDSEFNLLVDDLYKKFPSKSLNNLTRKEALGLIKAFNIPKWIIIVSFLITTLLISIPMYPMLQHFFDFGYKNITVENLISNPEFGTRNLTLKGYLIDAVLLKTTIIYGRITQLSKIAYLPIISYNWKQGDSINVILKFRGIDKYNYKKLFNDSIFTGVIRNIWWEGLNSDEIDFFKTNYNLTFSGNPILFEVTNEKHNDVISVYLIYGLEILAFMIVIGIIIAKRIQSDRIRKKAGIANVEII